MEGGLQGGESVVLQHVKQSLYSRSSVRDVRRLNKQVHAPSSRHCRDQGRGFWRSCATDLNGVSFQLSAVESGKDGLTKLREDVPEPVDDEHGGEMSGETLRSCWTRGGL